VPDAEDYLGPEARARVEIDRQLTACGWTVQRHEQMNLGAGPGVAVREFPMLEGDGDADYLLFVDRKAVGVIEAKKKGTPLTGVEWQSAKYTTGLPDTVPALTKPLAFAHESTGVETRFTNSFDPEPASRQVFTFHRPETLAGWVRAWSAFGGIEQATLRQRLLQLPPLASTGLWPAQETAIRHLEESFVHSRGAVIVSGPTEQGALPIWCAKSKAADELGAPAARDIAFYSAPGDSGFRTILSVLHGFGIPWVVVCDGKSFDVETNWSNHIFRQIEQAGIDFPELKGFTDRAGIGGKSQRRMTQASWDEQVDLGARRGVFTLTTSWTGNAEAAEDFIEGAARGKLAEAETEVGKSKIRRGRWVAEQTDCPPEVDDLYRQIVVALDREFVDAPSPGESLSQPDGTVAR
jgi:hypothetical protein